MDYLYPGVGLVTRRDFSFVRTLALDMVVVMNKKNEIISIINKMRQFLILFYGFIFLFFSISSDISFDKKIFFA